MGRGMGSKHLANLEGVPGHHPDVQGDPQQAHHGIENHHQPEGMPANPGKLESDVLGDPYRPHDARPID